MSKSSDFKHVTYPLSDPKNTLEQLLDEITHQSEMAGVMGPSIKTLRRRHRQLALRCKAEILRRVEERDQLIGELREQYSNSRTNEAQARAKIFEAMAISRGVG